MTDVEKLKVREAFDTMRAAAQKAKLNTPLGTGYVVAVAVLGWMLDDPSYAGQFEAMLREVRKMQGNRVTFGPSDYKG